MSDINEMNVGPRWYVAHTYSGYENKVKASLEKIVENRALGHLIFDIRIPVEKVIEKNGNEEKEVEYKLFPSYVYIKMAMTDESWHAVRNITGVTGFVGPGSRPTPLTEEEVADFCAVLPRYKRPRKIIFAEVPRNPTGKIEKPRLRKMYCGENLVAQQNEIEA